ncbi:MAG: 2Fe-2S iron-sulfur cluster-binding protein, partial [Candidatus Nanopelagicus sp.]
MSQFNIEFTFDGEKINAISGQSVAAALLAENVRTLRKTR